MHFDRDHKFVAALHRVRRLPIDLAPPPGIGLGPGGPIETYLLSTCVILVCLVSGCQAIDDHDPPGDNPPGNDPDRDPPYPPDGGKFGAALTP